VLTSKKAGAAWVPIEPPTPELSQAQDGIKVKTNVVTEPLRTTVTDLERVPQQHLLQYASGSSWSVDFYRQLKGRNDPMVIFDPKIVNPTQQFEKINNLELRVKDGLSGSQDSQTRQFTVSGSATVVNSIPPNVNDFFTADLGDNRVGLYNITSSQRGGYNKIATYDIEYTLLFEVTPFMVEIMKACTVREFYFVRDRAWLGEDTMLTAPEYRSFLAIGDSILNIEATYVKRFYDNELQTLRFPEERYRIYDVFLARFIRAIGLHVPGKDIRIYPHPPKLVQDIESFWDAMVYQTATYLRDTNRRIGSFAVQTFRTLQVKNTIGYSKFDYTLFFGDDNKYTVFPGEPMKFSPVGTDTINYRGNPGEDLVAFIQPTMNPYVLSEEFYNGSYKSVLEWGLQQFIHQQAVSSATALRLAELAAKLPRDAQFYYIPLVYVILRYAR